MKVLLSLVVFGWIINPTFAAEGPKNGPAFEEHKKAMLARLDTRAAKLAEHRACIAAAADREGMKACRQKMKDARKSMRAERDDD